MHDLLIGIAIVLGVAGAGVAFVPTIEAVRRFRRRRGIFRAFRFAAEDGQLRARFRREKEIFGDGFIDTFVGSAGTLRFRLTRRFRPFEKLDAYWLELGHSGPAGDEREPFAFRIETPEEGGHPVAATYRELRKRYPMRIPKDEAS